MKERIKEKVEKMSTGQLAQALETHEAWIAELKPALRAKLKDL